MSGIDTLSSILFHVLGSISLCVTSSIIIILISAFMQTVYLFSYKQPISITRLLLTLSASSAFTAKSLAINYLLDYFSIKENFLSDVLHLSIGLIPIVIIWNFNNNVPLKIKSFNYSRLFFVSYVNSLKKMYVSQTLSRLLCICLTESIGAEVVFSLSHKNISFTGTKTINCLIIDSYIKNETYKFHFYVLGLNQLLVIIFCTLFVYKQNNK